MTELETRSPPWRFSSGPRCSGIFSFPLPLLPLKAQSALAVCKLKQKAQLKRIGGKSNLTVILILWNHQSFQLTASFWDVYCSWLELRTLKHSWKKALMSRLWKSGLNTPLRVPGPTSTLHRFREKEQSDGPPGCCGFTAWVHHPVQEFTLGNTVSSPKRTLYTLFQTWVWKKKRKYIK